MGAGVRTSKIAKLAAPPPPPTCYRSLSGPSGPKCLLSVQKVSGHFGVTLGTHFLDTPEPGAQRAPGTPLRTLPRTPPFSGTPSATLKRHFGPGGPERLLLQVGGVAMLSLPQETFGVASCCHLVGSMPHVWPRRWGWKW